MGGLVKLSSYFLTAVGPFGHFYLDFRLCLIYFACLLNELFSKKYLFFLLCFKNDSSMHAEHRIMK